MLLEACSKHGVKFFTSENLEVEFYENAPSPIIDDEYSLTEIKQPPNNDTRSVPFDTALKEDELTKLLLSDPVAYEEMVDTND